ncbi:hypothetical protein K2X40_03425 [Candidatus Babeliales bacterium]|nr:hypothetical protein [Candidatus Babeliales bacterium]
MNELTLLLTSVECGLIFSLPVLGMFLSSRVLKVDDMTLEGSFGLGGALTALLLSNGVSPLVAMPLAMLAAGIAGLMTALLHTQLRLQVLMSGIIVTTALFSVNLLLAGANISLAAHQTIFKLCAFITDYKLLLLTLFALCCVLIIRWLLTTQVGFLLQATGHNPRVVQAFAKSPAVFLTVGLVLANMLTGLAGSLLVQYVGFFSIWSSVGTIIVTLAGLMLADMLSTRVNAALIAGAIMYQLVIALTFELQLNPNWNKLITALFIVALLTGKKMMTEKN